MRVNPRLAAMLLHLLAPCLLLPGCKGGHEGDHAAGHAHDEPGGHGDEHGAAQEEEGHGDHGHGHEGASLAITRWGAATQLFVEFPALVAGEDSPFAAHLTRLRDHLAIDSGKVVVELSGGGVPTERFTVDHPSVAGIFRPVVRPASPGTRHVTLRLDSEVASEVHDLGELVVFASRADADAAAGDEDEPADGISYLLEQQWRVPFRVEKVEARPMRPSIPAFARLTLPSDAESVISAPRDGRLVAVDGRFPLVGEEVTSGDVLFALTTAPQEGADPASLDLAVDQAQIRVSAAQRELVRLSPLVEQGVVAQRRLDAARSALATAQAELRSARRRLQSLGQSQRIDGSRDSLDVPSPISGTVAESFVAPGAWVTQGQRLARIVDRDRLWLDAGVPESYVGRLRDVSGAWFTLDSVHGVLAVPQSALVSVGTEVDPATRTLPVRFRIDNVKRELFAGMTTLAHLIVDTPRHTAAVPLDAVVDDAGTDVVYVQSGGESFVRRPVRLGIHDGDYVEVTDGVAPGEWVVARGAWSVRLASTSTESIGHGHAH